MNSNLNILPTTANYIGTRHHTNFGVSFPSQRNGFSGRNSTDGIYLFPMVMREEQMLPVVTQSKSPLSIKVSFIEKPDFLLPPKSMLGSIERIALVDKPTRHSSSPPATHCERLWEISMVHISHSKYLLNHAERSTPPAGSMMS